MPTRKKTEEEPCFIVSEETIKNTQKCHKDFSCLKGQGDDHCAVDSCINGKVHFVECLEKKYCSYQTSFGYGLICHCPVRKEIYNKYGV